MRLTILAILLAISFTASATNDKNECGNSGNNCGGGTSTATGGNASATGGNGYGLGIGYGEGGSATGGSVGDIRNTNSASGGSVLGSGNSSNTNVNTALGGSGGSAFQGQGQQQGQQQTSVNGQSQGIDSDIRNNVGTSTDTSTSTSTSQSQSANNAGNSQSVGGQSVTINEAKQPDDITIRQAPTMMVSAPYATVSCYKTFGGSVSGILGAIGASGGRIDQSCEHRELVRVAASVDPEGAKNVLCLNQMFQIANPKQCAGVRPVILLDKKAARQYRANQAAK